MLQQPVQGTDSVHEQKILKSIFQSGEMDLKQGTCLPLNFDGTSSPRRMILFFLGGHTVSAYWNSVQSAVKFGPM